MNAPSTNGGNIFQALRRIARPQSEVEQCDFCNAALAPKHRHLLEVATRKLVCVCNPCALRFENVIGRWKLVPRDAAPLLDFRMSDEEWEALALPINLAFFFQGTPAQKVVAMYPSPAGATESLLPLPSLEKLVVDNPVLASLQSDVEALLVNRLGSNRDYYRAPLDVCFELVGLIRMYWRGLSGGDGVWTEVEKFFATLKGATDAAPSMAQEVAHA